MKSLSKLMIQHEFEAVYNSLNNRHYVYTIENFTKDFSNVSSSDKYCYLLYALSKECSVSVTLLLGDFLLYTDTFFHSVHPIIRMIFEYSMAQNRTDGKLVEWLISTYEVHPDSPYTADELNQLKSKSQ